MTGIHNMTPTSDEGVWELDDGRVISANGEELFTAYYLPTVGRLVVMRKFKRRFPAAIPSMRQSNQCSSSESQTPYVSRRPAKSRTDLLCYNIHNDLRIAGTLTMSEWPKDVLKPLQRYIERLYYFRGDFPWTAVAEIGRNGNPHWHICLPSDFDIGDLEDRWETSSITDFQILHNHQDLLGWSLYLAKDFELKQHERLTYRRFHRPHGYKPKPIKLEGITKEEVLLIAQEQAALHGSELTEWEGSDAWCPKGYFWDV